MINLHFSFYSYDKNIREKSASGRSSSSSFREILRKQPKRKIEEDHQTPPSLFAMIQKEAEAQGNAKEDLAKMHLNIAELPSRSLISPTYLQDAAKPLASLPATSPWVFLLENTSQCISHLLTENLKETTLTLNGPMFTHTPLEGVKVIIREYSTAPLAFNIHFACLPDALSYLQPYLKTLASLFQNRRYPFSIHSVDADLGEGIPPPVQRDKEKNQQQEEGDV